MPDDTITGRAMMRECASIARVRSVALAGLLAALVLLALAVVSAQATCSTAAHCDDQNPCTDDVCDPFLGCLHAGNSSSCNDGNACTTNDVCMGDACVGGAPAIGCTPCQGAATIPAEGGTFSGATSGSSTLQGTCAGTALGPERVYRWTPDTAGAAMIQTCGDGTDFDSVVYLRQGSCTGPEVACNDDTSGCGTGEPSTYHGSLIVPTVTAGQTYYIVVDGWNGARGQYALTVIAPGICGNGVRDWMEECDGADDAGCASGQCTTGCTCVPGGTAPDLVPEIADVSLVRNTTVAAGDVAEGCAESRTGVDLLRFTLSSLNAGTGDIHLGNPLCPTPCVDHPLAVCGNPNFVCSPAQGHNHAHYSNYARYDLLDPHDEAVVVGHKQGFCLRDNLCTAPKYTCDDQGITVGCADEYISTLGCQYLDVTGVPPGAYTLRVTLDPFGRFAELNESNNVATVPVTIPAVTTTTLPPGLCPGATVIPAAGGTFTGVTSGASVLSGCVDGTALAPERVFVWQPAVSGEATIDTCGAVAGYDTVLYVRSGSCIGPQIACNDDTSDCPTGDGCATYHGSRVATTVTAGVRYYIVVDGYAGSCGRESGNFTLRVAAPGGSTTSTTNRTTTTLPTTSTSTTTIATTTSTTIATTTTTTARTTTTTLATGQPDIPIDTSVWANTERILHGPHVVCASPTTCYVVLADADRALRYYKTTDGGGRWAGPTTIKSGIAVGSMAVWYDQWTPGDRGRTIHVAFADETADDVWYVSLDTARDTLGTPRRVYDASLIDGGMVSLTKSRSGKLYLCWVNDSQGTEAGCRRSTDAFATSKPLNTPYEGYLDPALLFPANEPDPDDVWMVYWDVYAAELSLKTYRSATNSWSEHTITGGVRDSFFEPMEAAGGTVLGPQLSGSIRLSDQHLLLAASTQPNTATADLRVWDIGGAASITPKTRVVADAPNRVLQQLAINQQTNEVYVGYLGTERGTETFGTSLGVYYKRSFDGGATWTVEAPLSSSRGNFHALGGGLGGANSRFLLTWFDGATGTLWTNASNSIAFSPSIPTTTVTSTTTVPTTTTTLVLSPFGGIDAMGATDVTAQINAVLASLPNQVYVNFPVNGRYRIEGTLLLENHDGVTIDGHNSAFFARTDGSGSASAIRSRSQWRFRNDTYLTVKNLLIRGSSTSPGANGTFDSTREAQHGLSIQGCTVVTVTNVDSRATWGDPLNIAGHFVPTSYLTVQNSTFRDASRQVLSITSAHHVTITGNTLDQARRSLIDVEPNAASDAMHDITISGNRLGEAGFNTFSNGGAAVDGYNMYITDNTKTGAGPFAFVIATPSEQRRRNYYIQDNVGTANVQNVPFVFAHGIDTLVVTGNAVNFVTPGWPDRGYAPGYVTALCSENVSVAGNAFTPPGAVPILAQSCHEDVTVDPYVPVETPNYLSGPTEVCTSPTTCYVFYNDLGHYDHTLRYRKSTDGGRTWSDAVIVKADISAAAYAIWFDKWTPGDNGTKVHVLVVDTGRFTDTFNVWYANVDTATDVLSTPMLVHRGTHTDDTYPNNVFTFAMLAKSRGGTLYAGWYNDALATDGGFAKSTNEFGSTVPLASPWEGDADLALLVPGNEPSRDDMWLAFWDVSANELSLKTYNSTGNAWAETVIASGMVEAPRARVAVSIGPQLAGSIRWSDRHLILAANSEYNAATADLRVWDINGAGFITPKTNVVTNAANRGGLAVMINQNNNDLYVSYAGKADGSEPGNRGVYYKRSTDGGAGWGIEQPYSEASYNLPVTLSGDLGGADTLFLPVWHDNHSAGTFVSPDNSVVLGAHP